MTTEPEAETAVVGQVEADGVVIHPITPIPSTSTPSPPALPVPDLADEEEPVAQSLNLAFAVLDFLTDPSA